MECLKEERFYSYSFQDEQSTCAFNDFFSKNYMDHIHKKQNTQIGLNPQNDQIESSYLIKKLHKSVKIKTRRLWVLQYVHWKCERSSTGGGCATTTIGLMR